MGDRYCKDCVRLYHNNVDQCEIPDCGIFDMYQKTDELLNKQLKKKKLYEQAVYGAEKKLCEEDLKKVVFFIKRSTNVFQTGDEKRVYGHPSKLNYDNTCLFFLPSRSKRIKIFLRKYLKIKIK